MSATQAVSLEALFGVKDLSVVVMGAPGGIGAPLTRLLAGLGARLTIGDIDGPRLAALADELGDVPSFAGDICEEAVDRRLLALAIEHYGRIDAVVNAAGLLPIAQAETMPAEAFRRCIDVNLNGAFLLSRAAAAVMPAEGGAILHVASVSSTVANLGYAAYASSKAGLAQMVRVMAREWAPRHIRVNAIGPALIETPLTSRYLADDEFRQQAVAAIPAGRLALPADLLAPALLMIAPGGRFITGQTLYVDGGRTLV